MSSLNDQQNRSGAREAARKAAEAAKAAKSVKTTAKAVGKAAAGDYVGAAKDVLKDENLRLIVFVAVILVIVLPIMMFSLVPNVLFLPVESAYNSVRDFFVSLADIISGIFSG